MPQKALSERGIDKMLKEVREDNKDNDAEHMKPVSPICKPFQIDVNRVSETVTADDPRSELINVQYAI